MPQRTVTVFGRFDVPADVLWGAVVDHEGMGRWLGIPVRVIAGPGDGGVGTVRRVGRGPLSLDEEIIGCVPPRELVYRVVRGLPLVRYHLGEMRVVPRPGVRGGSELWWEVTVATPLSAMTEGLAAALSERLGAAVDRLRGQLEAP